MSTLFDSAFLQKIQHLALYTRFSLDGASSGNRKSRSKGSSVEFSDYREYAPGDDYRRLDWNAYGRFEKLFIKLFMEEREAPVTIFLDISKSMDWGEPNKSIASRKLAAALGYISLIHFDRVTVTCVDREVRQACRDVRGKNFFHKITDILETVSYSGDSNMQKAVGEFRMSRGRGITVLISDFFTEGSLDELLKRLTYHKQTVYLCQILSPQEIQPAVADAVRLVDSETGRAVDITVTPSLLNAYAKALDQFRSRTRESCSRWGAHYFSFSTERTVEEMVKEVSEH